MSERYAPWAEEGKSWFCGNDKHRRCGHVAGLNVGFNWPRRRRENDIRVCQCRCHSRCPVAAEGEPTVAPAAWRESCTCPGAEAEGRRLEKTGFDFSDSGESWDESRRRSRAWKEAYETVRAQAGGNSHDELREIYLAEISARGLKVPSDEILDAAVARMKGNPLPLARIVATGTVEGLAQFGKAALLLSRAVRESRSAKH
jgi:hypothetical protein